MHQTGAGGSSTQMQQIRYSVTGILEICNERNIKMISQEKPTCAVKCKTLLYCTFCMLLLLLQLQFIVFTIYVCLKAKLDFSGGCSRALLLLSWGIHLGATWSERLSRCQYCPMCLAVCSPKQW